MSSRTSANLLTYCVRSFSTPRPSEIPGFPAMATLRPWGSSPGWVHEIHWPGGDPLVLLWLSPNPGIVSSEIPYWSHLSPFFHGSIWNPIHLMWFADPMWYPEDPDSFHQSTTMLSHMAGPCMDIGVSSWIPIIPWDPYGHIPDDHGQISPWTRTSTSWPHE